jgi:A/G-specific adenine glycosylase
MQTIRKQLLEWFSARRRHLPWRETSDPYRIWVSEVMLQQTQVKTVVAYYTSFLEEFPYVEKLAGADPERVLKMWEGMGYYARARNLHRAAKYVCDRFGGRIPDDAVRFRKLPGVGDYICAAVQSIAFGAPLAVVDGNVKRVLARLFEIDAPVNKPASHKIYQAAADRLLDRTRPGEFNQAVMELGALVCRPKAPCCDDCPVRIRCRALQASRQVDLPVRARRSPTPTRRVAVGVIENGDRVLITKRRPEGLLGGLWEFPGGKIDGNESADRACAREVREETGLAVEVGEYLARVEHAYTHFKVQIDVFRCRYRGGEVVLDGPVDYRWVDLRDIGQFPLPKASHKILPHLSEKYRKD